MGAHAEPSAPGAMGGPDHLCITGGNDLHYFDVLQPAQRWVAPSDGRAVVVPLLALDVLTKRFPLRGGLLNRTQAVVHAVDDVSFQVEAGETLGIVGESGCGKSTTARLLMHLVPLDRGTIAFDGRAIGAGAGPSRRDLHRQMQMVFQDSYASLNPRLPVAMSIAFAPLVHGLGKQAAPARARDLLQSAG